MPVLCVRCGYTVERTPEMYCPRCGAMLYYQENEVAYTGNTEPAVRKESTTTPVVHEESITDGNKMNEECKVVYDAEGWQKQASDYAKELYNDPESHHYMKMLDWVAEEYQPGNRILEVGCAGGHNYKRLLERKHIDDYTGIDITKAYIDLARKKFPECRWDQGDARALPYKDKEFDITFCFQVLLHLDEEGATKALLEMARVTKDMIFILTPTATERHNGVAINPFKGSVFLYNILGMNELKIPGWRPLLLQPIYRMAHVGPLCCFPDDLDIYGEFVIINEEMLRLP